jgi:DNA repair exonuclease SbcCD ATPase subunit
MKLDIIKPLLESGLINEDIGQQLNEAWETKLNEAREHLRAELREEFAQRYEHDRTVMVEALDKMMTENLSEEIEEFRNERQAMNEERVQAQLKLRENATKFNDFMVTKLAEEIRELRTDRKTQMEGQAKLEQFIVHALAREIKEFAQDRKAVVEAKVHLVAEGRKQLEALKEKFISESAKKVSGMVGNQLKSELSQLKEDIQSAKENNFGRKLFEAFASEFSVTHLNEKAETRKIMQQLEAKNKQLAEATARLENAKKLVESKDREVRIIKESTQRSKVMNELLAPLNEEKKQVMKTLLESVQTPRLHYAFEKYLPAVLNTASEGVKSQKKPLTESTITEVTGDKTAKKIIEVDEVAHTDNVIDIKRLAGL